jgi:hypothetical protein
MRIAFELVFYIMINLVPSKVDKFQANFQKDNQKVLLEFTRKPNNHWQVIGQVNGQARKETLQFWFDENQANYYEVVDGNTRKHPFGARYNIKRNRKKWRKASKVTYTIKPSLEKVMQFKITKQGKKRYEVKPTGKEAEADNFPKIKVSWK